MFSQTTEDVALNATPLNINPKVVLTNQIDEIMLKNVQQCVTICNNVK